MFRSYIDECKYNLKDKLDIIEIIDIFTSEGMENTSLESRMLFHMKFTSGVFSMQQNTRIYIMKGINSIYYQRS